ncbi:hypothetical protein BJ322DRAFT_1217216 [Thelephora terrestris]|uniref:Uncharacterized protein n=1 Tax=Thelephora terrestris TaxID=56493 RepID=A0A9P6HJ88_9AGAM|nr:hypothetical protein BJ322DRAFT_1217216 [Thelephora terrestris]
MSIALWTVRLRAEERTGKKQNSRDSTDPFIKFGSALRFAKQRKAYRSTCRFLTTEVTAPVPIPSRLFPDRFHTKPIALSLTDTWGRGKAPFFLTARRNDRIKKRIFVTFSTDFLRSLVQLWRTLRISHPHDPFLFSRMMILSLDNPLTHWERTPAEIYAFASGWVASLLSVSARPHRMQHIALFFDEEAARNHHGLIRPITGVTPTPDADDCSREYDTLLVQ